jgi:hypothetical protein
MPGSNLGRGKDFSFIQNVQNSSRVPPPSLLFNGYQDYFSGVKQQLGREVDQ